MWKLTHAGVECLHEALERIKSLFSVQWESQICCLLLAIGSLHFCDELEGIHHKKSSGPATCCGHVHKGCQNLMAAICCIVGVVLGHYLDVDTTLLQNHRRIGIAAVVLFGIQVCSRS